MSTPHDSGTLAQALFRSMHAPWQRYNHAALTLLEHLVARADVDLQMPWGVKRNGKRPFDSTLAQALVWEVSPGSSAPLFYTGETAGRFLAMDAGIFSSRTPEGEWWFWSHLESWSAVPEPIRSGFDMRLPGGPDAWAARVIQSLPQSALEGPDAKDRWSLLLSMGLGHAAVAFASRVPKMWTARDPKGALLLRKAKGAEVWDGVIESGLDPFAPPPGDKAKSALPLWRQVLPKTSRTAPEPGSFREGVEAWLTQQVLSDHPAKPDILKHKVRWISSWLTARPSGPPRRQQEVLSSEVMSVLSQQPAEWLSCREPQVGWAQPFLSPILGHPKRWAKALKGSPEWYSAAGPGCEIAVALFDSPFLDKVPEAVIGRFLQSPILAQEKEALATLAHAKIWGNRSPSPEKMESFLEACEMDVALPAASSPGSAPRSRF